MFCDKILICVCILFIFAGDKDVKLFIKMIGPGNNQPFRPNNPGHSHGPGPLGQLLGQNVETIIIGPGDDNVGNGGLHITQVFPTPSSHANNFFFNYPGQYNISLGNDVSSGRLQAHLGQLAR